MLDIPPGTGEWTGGRASTIEEHPATLTHGLSRLCICIFPLMASDLFIITESCLRDYHVTFQRATLGPCGLASPSLKCGPLSPRLSPPTIPTYKPSAAHALPLARRSPAHSYIHGRISTISVSHLPSHLAMSAFPFWPDLHKNPEGSRIAFPSPPPFFKSFTPTNNAALAATLDTLRVDARTRADKLPKPSDIDPDPERTALRLQRDDTLRARLTQRIADGDVDPDVLCLVPPAPPPDGAWTSFGESYTLAAPNPTSFPAPPPSAAAPDPRDTLLATTRAVLLRYLRLVGLLARNPELAAGEVGLIEAEVRRAHEAANLYRPHQAREGLIEALEGRLERGRREIEAVRRMQRVVGERLGEVRGEGLQGEGGGERGVEEGEGGEGVAVWGLLEEVEVRKPEGGWGRKEEMPALA